MVRFGIEEEFMLLDPRLLTPVDRAGDVVRRLADDPASAAWVGHEFLASQVEYSSAVFDRADEARAGLAAFRGALGAIADEFDLVAAGMGVPFDIGGTPLVTRDDRYEQVSADMRAMLTGHQVNAVHVHVNIPDREAGVIALNGIRPWLPVLLALGANSPFWRGVDTGFASWRSVARSRTATSGVQPSFIDAADYARRAAQLARAGIIGRPAGLAWNARLSDRFNTIEIRVFDAQLSAADTLPLALITRALVTTALHATASAPADEPELLAAAAWLASRDGLGGDLLLPANGERTAAADVVQSLLRHVEGALAESGDAELVEEAVARLLRDGTGADRQRKAFGSGGRAGLGRLLLATLRGGADAVG